MTDNSGPAFVIGILVGCIVGLFGGCAIASDAEVSRVIKAGAAHYEVNPRTGETKLVYTPEVHNVEKPCP